MKIQSRVEYHTLDGTIAQSGLGARVLGCSMGAISSNDAAMAFFMSSSGSVSPVRSITGREAKTLFEGLNKWSKFGSRTRNVL